MKTGSADLDRFLRAVHRRWVVVRIAEVTGVGVAAGCGLALLVLPILLWRGEPALPVVIAAAAVAAVAGMIAGVIRRPDLASAAAEADRQLDLADLLSTALATRDRAADDPWAAVVVATASARCRTLAPSAVIVNRFGGRAWGGIGLATALVLTLGLMSADPRQSAAVTPAGDDDAIDGGLASSRVSPRDVDPGPTPRRAATDGRDRETASAMTADGAASDPADQSTGAASASESGGGAGIATSPRTANVARPQQASAAGSRGQAVGDASAGGASAGPAPTSGIDDRSSASAAASPPSNRAPAWRSSAWPVAREEALSGVRDGTIDGQYRDLVRAYFDQSSE